MEETSVWKGRSSQVLNLGTYIVCGLLCWLIVPVFIAVWKWLQLRARVYELTNQRLHITTGVFSKKTEDMELYRVKDTTLERPFFLRLFKLGNIVLHTSDRSTPTIVIQAIPEAETLRHTIRQHVEVRRDQKRVREIDFE